MTPFETWLVEIGLGRYDVVFASNAIDFDVIRSLTDADLRELGLALGDRKRLLQALVRLDGQKAADPSTQSIAPASGPIHEEAVSHGGERRQLTVMFCDLVGSTTLSQKLDPEELRELLHAYRNHCGDVIARYDGFIARYVGDGILTYFGWPNAHEEDAERAVRAALGIVHTVRRASSTEALSVRIGIATGPVVVGEQTGVGDQSRLAVGSTPNLAARLQGLATADQIVIAASTHRLIGNAFELSYLGEHDLKGIAEPVHAWRVERGLLTESRFDASRGGQALTPLVGRDEELDLLLRRWSQAKEHEGQVALLSGEPGIGKSRILSALRERLEAQGVQALRFQCSPYYVNSAFWPVIDNLERMLKFTRDETIDAKLDKLEALVVAQYGRPLADVRFVAAILSIPCTERYGTVPMTPQKQKDETLRTLIDLIEAAARHYPTAMLFEDAHWVDPTTLEVLDLLIDRVKTVPLLVVLTHRPEFGSRWSQHGHVGALNLSKLTRAQSASIVSALAAGKALPTALLEQILSRTDGVPLFVEELTKFILELGELKQAGDHYDYAGSARAVTIPATLRDSLMARLDRFMPVKEIAQIGAVIGREFSYELIAAVAPMPQTQLDDALAQLIELGLAFRRGTPPEAIYTFKHALVQDAAYDSLLRSRRRELHAKIARVIEQRLTTIKTTEPEVLAHHLTEGGLAEAAVPLWQAAGELALKRMALAESIAHLNRGLDLIPTMPASPQRDSSELELRSLLGIAWLVFKGWWASEIWSSLHPALPLARSLRRYDALVGILGGLTVNLYNRGRVANSLPWLNEMLGVAETTGDTQLRIGAHEKASFAYFWAGEFTKSLEHAEKVLELYNSEPHRHPAQVSNVDPKSGALRIGALSTWILGFTDRALRMEAEKEAYARRRGHPFFIAEAIFFGTHMFDDRVDLCTLYERATEIDRLGRDNSLPVLLVVMAPSLRSPRAAQGGQIRRTNPLADQSSGDAGGNRRRRDNHRPNPQGVVGGSHGGHRGSRQGPAPARQRNRANRTSRVGGAVVLSRGSSPQGLDTVAQRRS